MELVKRNLHQMCRKSEAVSQVTFDEDLMFRMRNQMWEG